MYTKYYNVVCADGFRPDEKINAKMIPYCFLSNKNNIKLSSGGLLFDDFKGEVHDDELLDYNMLPKSMKCFQNR